MEPWAFDAEIGGRIELVSPSPAAGQPQLGADQPVEVAVPTDGTVWFKLGDAPAIAVEPIHSDGGRIATWNPGVRPAGSHVLLAVFQSDDATTFTALARIIRVEGGENPNS